MPLLTFDAFEAALPALLEEADQARARLPPVRRLGDDGALAVLGRLTQALARALPRVDRPLEPGIHLLGGGRTDVRADALEACALVLEALHAVRSTMTLEQARARDELLREAIARHAFDTFAAPSGLPVEQLEWTYAIEQVGVALTFLFNPRLGAAIGSAGAHDALERAGGHAFCVLALIDAHRAAGRDAR
jgi:hypothetical protein